MPVCVCLCREGWRRALIPLSRKKEMATMKQMNGGNFLIFRVGEEKGSPQDKEDKLWTGNNPEWNLPIGLNFSGISTHG